MRRVRSTQRGNAILISLIIMASTLSISLGITALVGSEIKSTSLLEPSERAYYKAESYVEQALWNKTKGNTNAGYGAGYQAPSRELTDGGTPARPPVKNQAYACTPAPCFNDGRSTDAILKRFSATTQPTSDTFNLAQDEPQQLDITGTAGATVQLEASDIRGVTVTGQNPAGNYKGIEVTVIANPISATAAGLYQSASGRTASQTFVDKVVIGPNETAKQIPLTNQTNDVTSTIYPLGEPYPPFTTYKYRLRVKALGSDATATLKVTSAGGQLKLQTPDFTALAVAEDGKAQRGVQVVVPDVPEVLNIFDYVLFADADLQKLNAKRTDDPPTQQIIANVYEDHTCDGSKTGDPNVSGVDVGLTDNQTGDVSSTTSDSTGGNATFTGLYPGSYTVDFVRNSSNQPILPPGYEMCPNAAPQTVTVTAGQDTTLSLRIKAPRVALHKYFSQNSPTGAFCWNTYFTTTYAGASFGGYNYQGIIGYVYPQAMTNTVLLYRMVNYSPQCDHWITSSFGEYAFATGSGAWTADGNAGYVGTYTGPQGTAGGANPYNNSCPAGTLPLYRSWVGVSNGISFYDHSLSTTYINTSTGSAYQYQRIEGCIWTAA